MWIERVCVCPNVQKATELTELATAVGAATAQFALVIVGSSIETVEEKQFGEATCLATASNTSGKDARFLRCRIAPLTSNGLPEVPANSRAIENKVQGAETTALRILVPKQGVSPQFLSDMCNAPVDTVLMQGLQLTPKCFVSSTGGNR